MRVQVIIGMGVIAWTTYTAFAQAPSAPPTKVGQVGLYACLKDSDIQATWSARGPFCPTVQHQGQLPPLILVGGVGPIDMDNRRQDEELRERARRDEALRQQYRYYGYAYPPGRYNHAYPPRAYSYTYPPQGYTHSGPQNGYTYYPGGRPYSYNPTTRLYYDPKTGRYFSSPPRNVYPENRYNNRPNEQRRERR